MPVPPIRTITLGLAEAHPLAPQTVQRAAALLQRAQAIYTEAGYEIQTLRLSLRPLFDDLVEYSASAIINYVQELHHQLDELGLEFCSLGPAQAARADFPLARLELIEELLVNTRAFSMTVQLATTEHGLRLDAVAPTAHIIQHLARETEEGAGNFRFAMLACVPPGSPFFPAAYHSGPESLSIGLQGASIVWEALQEKSAEMAQELHPQAITHCVREALIEVATPICTLGERIAREQNSSFGGIDLSPAPMGTESIVPALELGSGGPLGTPGTLSVASALTAALKSTNLPTCGYCGLMLPVLEDALLGQRWAEGRITIAHLLLYSSVCGTGLDVLPLAGDISDSTLGQLLLDVATLALRLQKPLSARLFPVPGRRIGEYTTFTLPYLTNTRITV